jgi:PPM family protein phosphatase
LWYRKGPTDAALFHARLGGLVTFENKTDSAMSLLHPSTRKSKVKRREPAPETALIQSALGPKPHAPFAVRSYGLSDCGQVRRANEDRFLIVELARAMQVHQTNVSQSRAKYSSHRGHVFLVADGVGGNNAGEVASVLTVETIEEFLLNTLRRFSNLQISEEQSALTELQNALLQADCRIFAETKNRPEWHGMGTTLTLAFAVNWTLFIAHAGDSRCYLFSKGELNQLTHDHTFTGELIRQGILSQEKAAQHPYRHVVTNILGGTERGVKVELHRLDLHPEDVILLCSDGLTEMIPADRIVNVLREERNPQRACERLVAEANQRGGKDNITVIVARIEQSDNRTRATG